MVLEEPFACDLCKYCEMFNDQLSIVVHDNHLENNGNYKNLVGGVFLTGGGGGDGK